jgi:hypothetical protein
MNGILVLVALFVLFGLGLAVIAFVAYRGVLRRAKSIERGLKMVPLLIHLPPSSDDVENSGSRDERDIMREKIAQADVLYDLIAGTAKSGFKSNFYGQRHIAFEIIASNGLIHYFAAVPIAMVPVVEQAVLTAYPGAKMEEVEDHNIFNPQGNLTGTVGGELTLSHDYIYPIATYKQIERDPMEAIINALTKLQQGDGAAIQMMLRPARGKWTRRSENFVAKKRHTAQGGLGFGASDLAKATVKTPDEWRAKAQQYQPSKLEETVLESIEEKTRYPGYEVLVRVLVSTPSYDRSQALLRTVTNAFSLFEAPGMNGFKFIEGRDIAGLVTAFIFRFFPPELSSDVLNSVELATMFHLPDAQFVPTLQVERQLSKQTDGPVNVAHSGLLFGYNVFRGTRKEIRLDPEDRRRHSYIIGQTGTGKSVMLENLAVQDMLSGNGFAFIDPHGESAEKLLQMVPKERAEDVIYFNPADMENPLGLNLFEFQDPQQKDFLIQEAINMVYKIYDPQKTGIVGPRFEHWFRNAALTIMADPAGGTYIEVPKVFTDSAYLKRKFKYLQDPAVIDFWTKEMGQTSDYHKSEMLGWFVSKFGALMSNEMMRNIIGQTKSSFNLREVMDQKKILIVNLSKGQVGEINSQLLGLIFVIKFQAAAMSRANVDPSQRPDFCLYVDEFQNFSTDSFASILSEARKYGLNLIVANQFIGQLTPEIRDSVFGNVGTLISHRTGPEDAEFLAKQFEPIFDVHDISQLPNHNSLVKLLIGGVPSQPFSMVDLPPLGVMHQEMGLAIKQLSAAKYGRPRSGVEQDIFNRMEGRVAPPSAAPAPVTPPVPAAVPVAAPVSAASAPPPSPVASGPEPPTMPPAAIPVPTAPLPSKPSAPMPAPPLTKPSAPPASAVGIADVVGEMPAAATPLPPKPEPVTSSLDLPEPHDMLITDHSQPPPELSHATARPESPPSAPPKLHPEVAINPPLPSPAPPPAPAPATEGRQPAPSSKAQAPPSPPKPTVNPANPTPAVQVQSIPTPAPVETKPLAPATVAANPTNQPSTPQTAQLEPNPAPATETAVPNQSQPAPTPASSGASGKQPEHSSITEAQRELDMLLGLEATKSIRLPDPPALPQIETMHHLDSSPPQAPVVKAPLPTPSSEPVTVPKTDIKTPQPLPKVQPPPEPKAQPVKVDSSSAQPANVAPTDLPEVQVVPQLENPKASHEKPPAKSEPVHANAEKPSAKAGPSKSKNHLESDDKHRHRLPAARSKSDSPTASSHPAKPSQPVDPPIHQAQKPGPEPSPPQTEPAKPELVVSSPKLAPGEIFVDDDGNVVQG